MPNYCRMSSLPLFVPGDASTQTLVFSKPVVLWASPANPGAAELARELARAFPGLAVSTVADVGSSAAAHPSMASRGLARRTRRAGDVTHMLLYLNQTTWLEHDGERLAEQVKQAREDKLKIVMVHENDPALGGCAFDRMFEVTPQELINDGLYRDLARSFFPGVYREAPLAILVCGCDTYTSDWSVSLGVTRAAGEGTGRNSSQGKRAPASDPAGI